VINGTAYPTLTVDPKAYRLRILNASNDRYINLGLFKADPTVRAPQLDLNGNPIVGADGVAQVFRNTEVRMVPAVGDAAGNPPGWDAVNGVQLPALQYPGLRTNINGEPSGPMRAWPVDSRAGGAPDPTTAGPDFIVIGNDGGFLPAPVDIPAQPVTYEANRRSITVGNIYGYGLLLGPAERSDAIVDFSKYAGQTLILYNDAPAPTPFTDSRNDYFTGDPDQTSSGGTYSTKPGYGPNTRTMMQIRVNAAAAAAPYDPTLLLTALPTAYAASQPAPIVPATVYNPAFGTNDTDIYAHVATGSAAQPNLEFSTGNGGFITLQKPVLITSGGLGTGSGTGYDPLKPPKVVFNNLVNGVSCLGVGGVSASATAVVDPGTRQVKGFLDSDWNAGSNYVCAPTITFENPPGTNGVGAQASVQSSNAFSYPVLTKAEQELFDNRGRYNSTGGVELPLTNALLQTTIPLNYIDSVTEKIGENEVQIWKIVDNGLWTNSIHFDMVDVQLINRVGWDGTVKAPATNELGWKDTVRLNPLEDVIVAMRAKRPQVPFGMPKSSRLMDPSKPADGAGSGTGFTNAPDLTVPGTNTPFLAATNKLVNFDNEFTWGSAILSHSENDFRRPVVFNPTVTVPDAPTNLNDPSSNGVLTWTDPTPAATSLREPKNEIGFKIVEATNTGIDQLTGKIAWTYSPFLLANGKQATVPANTTNWTPPVTGTPADANKAYAVVAYNAAGDSAPSTPFSETLPTAPTAFEGVATCVASCSVALTWSGNSTNNIIQIWRDGILVATLPGAAQKYVDATVGPVATYNYTIKLVNIGSASSGPIAVTTPMLLVAAPTIVSATPNAGGTAVALGWTDNANNETAYQVEVLKDGVADIVPSVINRSSAQGTSTGGLVNYSAVTTPGSVYEFKVTAVNVTGGGTSLSPSVLRTVDLSAPAAPAAPSGLTAAIATTTRVALNWVDNATTESSYLVTVTNTTTGQVMPTATVARSAAQSAASGGNVAYNATVAAGNSYSFKVVAQATAYGQTSASTAAVVVVDMTVPSAPTGVSAAAGASAGQVVVTWTDSSNNESGFTVQRSTATVRRGVTTWSGFANAGTVAAGQTTFTDTGRTTGTQYQYQVRANSPLGNSAYVGPTGAVVAP
jgi:FtsP/CotA-like multicopper oxidase with cupredoxin domain